MKLSITKLFSKESLEDKIVQKLTPLIDFINTSTEQIVRALQNKLTFADNFNCEVKALSDVVHGVTLKLTVKGLNPVLTVIPLAIFPVNNTQLVEAIPQIAWRLNDVGQLEVTPYTRTASVTQKYSLSVLILYS